MSGQRPMEGYNDEWGTLNAHPRLYNQTTKWRIQTAGKQLGFFRPSHAPTVG